MITFLTNALIGYVIFCVIMYLLQDKFIYFPERTALNPESYGLKNFEPLMLTTQDDVDIATWWHPPLPGYPTIIYYHGNAGHMGMRAYKFKAMQEAGYGIMALSYRGYGASEGVPSEHGLYEDARTAIAFVVSELGIPQQKVILYGESLGSGVAVNTAAIIKGIGMVVLEAPYTSVVERAKEKFPMLPVKLLLRSRFNSIAKLHHLEKVPVLIFHGEKDTVIPVAHGRKMLEVAGDPKKGIFYPDYGHTDFDAKLLVKEITTFAKEHNLLNPKS